MKSFREQTYYELLEVRRGAPAEEVRAALRRALDAYAPDSVALYALVDEEQAEALRSRSKRRLASWWTPPRAPGTTGCSVSSPSIRRRRRRCGLRMTRPRRRMRRRRSRPAPTHAPSRPSWNGPV